LNLVLWKSIEYMDFQVQGYQALEQSSSID
jgi:hypothetical protein